jgi:exopolysaccharide biosynthesis predicted pyruvyltransferase EpsI
LTWAIRNPGRAWRLALFLSGISKRKVGLVGFFGHGNYGDELFVSVFEQYLADRFSLEVIPDLERDPYFSRPVSDVVSEVDSVVMGGGDLVQRWSTDPRYFDKGYLEKPFFAIGLGVPIYQDSERHQERPHIIRRLQGFFGHKNVRRIVMRDDFGADWIREKLAPSAPVVSVPDIVCSLDLPAVQKPEGKPILSIVTRQRRVSEPDDYSKLRELAHHAHQRGFRIRHIVLGVGSVGARDFDNADALDFPEKELVYTESLDELSRAIGESTVLASMKFHGTVVATMYGVPSMVLVPTNKNINFMARIGREDLVTRFDAANLCEIFGEKGPQPIDPASIQMLRENSTRAMRGLRTRLIHESKRAIMYRELPPKSA